MVEGFEPRIISLIRIFNFSGGFMKKMHSLIILFLCYAVLFLTSCGDWSDGGSSITKNDYPSDGIVSTTSITMTSILQAMEKGRYVAGELLVKFKKDHVPPKALHRAMGSIVLRRFRMLPEMEHVRLPERVSVREGILRYMSDPSVEYAEPNYIRRISKVPDDPFFDQQWSLLNSGQFNGTPGSDIKATDTWDINTGSSDAMIAILDTGMDYNHPDLLPNRWINNGEIPDNGVDDDGNGKIDDRFGWDFTTCSKFNPNTGICSIPKLQDKDPMDDNGHGTHVSGIIGASGNNGIGISGVMWNARLMPLKILNADGEGTIADEIAALDYAVMMKTRGANIKVINASFGGGAYSVSEYNAIKKVNDSGIIFVTAAGNGGDDGIGDNNDVTPSYPGNYDLPNIISVAATDQRDNIAPFSNYGLNKVHVAAPGVHILSIVPSGLNFYSGTSMATPHVSGLVGLLYSQYPHFLPSQVKSTIMKYVDELPSLQGKTKSGGRINAYKAVSALLSPMDFRVINVSSNSVSLKWNDRATGEAGFRIERRDGSSPYSVIATLPANSDSYDDFTVIDGLSYSYRIKAYNDIADSNDSEVVAITPLKTPSNLSANAGITEITLSWIDNSASEEGFRIERKGPDGVFVLITTVGPNTTTFTDTNLQQSTTYSYRVKAFNSVAGESSPAEVTVSTGSPSTSTGSSGGGGGGCSVIARGETEEYDLSILMMLSIYGISRLVKRLRRS